MLRNEETKAKSYMLETDENDLVEINSDNIAKTIAMFMTDSNYMTSVDYNNTDSSAYCFKKLFEEKTRGYDDILNAVKAINRENSTRVSSKDQEEIAERISKDDSISFDPEKWTTASVDNLLEVISNRTSNNHKRHFSFATKFCHYATYYLYKTNKNAKAKPDDYPIIDEVIKDVLPRYAAKKGIPVKGYRKEFKASADAIGYYNTFRSILSELSNKTGCSCTGIDLLLWYYHKGRDMHQTKEKDSQ